MEVSQFLDSTVSCRLRPLDKNYTMFLSAPGDGCSFAGDRNEPLTVHGTKVRQRLTRELRETIAVRPQVFTHLTNRFWQIYFRGRRIIDAVFRYDTSEATSSERLRSPTAIFYACASL